MQADTLAYLDSVANASDLAEVWNMLCDKLARFGFDRLIYGYNRFGTETSFGPWQDALILSNLEESYLKTFIEGEYYLHAPLTQWAIHNTGARSWDYLDEAYKALDPCQRKVVDWNMANGLTAGYSISFPHASPRTRAALSMGARAGLSQQAVNAIWARHGQEIQVIANMTHLKIISLPNLNERARLSRRQQEVLNWVAEGKTNQDIATILGVTPATVEKHLRLVREKLNVDTTAQAVLKAAFWNQVFVLKG